MNSITPVITALFIYPVKSCGSIHLKASTLDAAGLTHDREWMVAARLTGKFVSQRDAPRLALIRPSIAGGHLTLSAPGRSPLVVALDHGGAQVAVEIWNHSCNALDAGPDAAEWFSELVGFPVRLVRFDPRHRRLSNLDWTDGVEAPNRFSDGYPLLVLGCASLAALNERLRIALPMNRFRPNIVVDGTEAHDEDRWRSFQAGAAAIRLVKPCVRCEITTTDQDTGVRSDTAEPLMTLATYRTDPRMQGGITFGQNAIVTHGSGTTIQVGQAIEQEWNF